MRCFFLLGIYASSCQIWSQWPWRERGASLSRRIQASTQATTCNRNEFDLDDTRCELFDNKLKYIAKGTDVSQLPF
jgi:flagellar basal body rod protein FlgB